ncbi:MAG: carboxypeptidase-like regulatory domain-containing protein [Bacteroidia bacterium]
MSITRRLPTTIITRQTAINNANEANTNPPGGVNALTAATQARVVAQTPLYNQAIQASAAAKGNLNTHTPVKDGAVNTCRMLNSHFIQVFNLGVARGKYPAGHRSYYGLETSSDAVPDMGTEDLVKLWAHRLIDGDADRLLNGGLPMANPDIAEVQAALTAMETQMTAHDNFVFLLDQKQEAVESMNALVDPIIKKVWDEVETYFNEETPESKRANARLWGVVYVTEGAPATLTGLVKDPAGAVVPNALITIDESSATATTNSEGRYVIETTVLGEVTLRTEVGALAGKITLTIPDHTTGIDINVADIVLE